MNRLLAFVWGVVFALGLGVSGVARPSTILGHLDLFGAWDPSLLIALCSGAFVYAIFYHGVTRLIGSNAPVQRHVPTNRKIDRSLVLGTALFGAGWGIAGMCPGAALASAAHPDGRVFIFVIAMGAGMLAHGPTRAKLKRIPRPSALPRIDVDTAARAREA